MGSVGVTLHGWARVVDVASYVVLPSLTLGLFYMAVYARLTPAALLVGAVSTVVALSVGVTLGAVAGYAGGWLDDALMPLTEFFQTIPSFVLAIVVVAIFTPSLGSIVGAMALALQPALLIADEPTTALDVTTQKKVLTLIRDVQRRRGMGVLFITHDFDVVAEVADRVAVMRQGEIVEQGTASEVLTRPPHPYTQALIAAVPGATRTPRPPVTAPVLLRLTDVGRAFGATQAVDGVSLDIRRGQTLGVVGESGSGKSPLARCAVDLVRLDRGVITFDGIPLTGLSHAGWAPVRRRIGMVFPDPFASLNPRRRVGAIVAEGLRAHGVQDVAARVAALLARVQLDPAATNHFPREFSGGQRQRIGIARALALAPELLIADEPVSALDVSVQAGILALLEQLRTELGLAMLFITHDLRVAAQVCDRVAVMQAGRVVETRPTQDVFARPTHAYTRTLLASVPGAGAL